MTVPTTRDSNAPPGHWPGDVVHGWEWPVLWGWHIEFEDGSEEYYPSWHVVPNKILEMQNDGSYENTEVTVVDWTTET